MVEQLDVNLTSHLVRSNPGPSLGDQEDKHTPICNFFYN